MILFQVCDARCGATRAHGGPADVMTHNVINVGHFVDTCTKANVVYCDWTRRRRHRDRSTRQSDSATTPAPAPHTPTHTHNTTHCTREHTTHLCEPSLSTKLPKNYIQSLFFTFQTNLYVFFSLLFFLFYCTEPGSIGWVAILCSLVRRCVFQYQNR